MAETPKHRKRMTQKEKDWRAAVKKGAQARGEYPPDKKRLNRKAFAAEVMNTVFGGDYSFYSHLEYVVEGIAAMTPHYKDKKVIGSVTPEQVGILKALKIALELEAFWKRKKDKGITDVKFQEIYEEVFKPIMDL